MTLAFFIVFRVAGKRPWALVVSTPDRLAVEKLSVAHVVTFLAQLEGAPVAGTVYPVPVGWG